MSGDALKHALRYATRGWPVLPCHSVRDRRCSCTKVCSSPGKHPRTAHGYKDASQSPEIIWQWWQKWPDANLGVATGRGSGLVVLDVDPRNGGDVSFEELEHALGGPLPDTPTVLTGGGGTHVYFRYPDSAVPSVGSFFPGLDVKADGGFVIAPPSNHSSGTTYEWSPWLPDAITLAPVPEPLLQLIRSAREPEPRSLRKPSRCVDLPAWEAVRRFPRVRSRFYRDARGLRDTSPSGIDYSLACQLSACGYSSEVIREVVEESRAQAGLCHKADSYFRATIDKALQVAS
jgi:hypothetical protein